MTKSTARIEMAVAKFTFARKALMNGLFAAMALSLKEFKLFLFCFNCLWVDALVITLTNKEVALRSTIAISVGANSSESRVKQSNSGITRHKKSHKNFSL